MTLELDVDDPYDWRCFYCGQGFFDGADRFEVGGENCCDGCRDGCSTGDEGLFP